MIPLREIPGPNPKRPLHNLLQFWKDPLGTCLKHSQEFGSRFQVKLGPRHFFFTTELEDIREVLITNRERYIKSESYEPLKLALGQGLVTSEHEVWKKQRPLAQPAFHPRKLTLFHNPMVQCTADMLRRWETGPSTFDLHQEMNRLTFRIVGLTLLSTDLDDQASDFGRALSEGLHFINRRIDTGALIPMWVPLPSHLRFKRNMKLLDRVILDIITEREAGAEHPPDLLSLLMEAKDEATGEKMDARQLRDEITTMVIAGHETTSMALTMTLVLLSQHQDVRDKLLKEVDNVLKGEAPTPENIQQLKYTEMVIKEAIRLYPPAWIFERSNIEEEELNGIKLPPMSIIAMPPYLLHREAGYWPDPLRFDPERFSQEAEEARPRYHYLPFGAGPRVCIGGGFALMETKLVIAMILQKVTITQKEEGIVPLFAGVTLRPQNPVAVTSVAR
jgi:cytochrome P450